MRYSSLVQMRFPNVVVTEDGWTGLFTCEGFIHTKNGKKRIRIQQRPLHVIVRILESY